MTLATATATTEVLHHQADPAITTATHFLAAWDTAWKHHDGNALGDLHTLNAVTINRFGTLLLGRAPTEKALAFLHSKEGPFGNSTFPPLRLLEARPIAPDVVIVNAAWKNPVMHPDGKVSDAEWSDMIVTFVLVREGQTWRASEVDAHNVQKMELPYSNPAQKS